MKNYFFSGLIILLPLVITYWIIKFIVNVITGPFEEFAQSILENAGYARMFSKVLILLALSLIILAVGVIGRWFFFRSLFHLFDQILHALPVVNKVYLSCKDFTSALFSPKSDSFSQVVIVPFPSASHRSIGLITSEFKNDVIEGGDDKLISVLIPGTPNPTVGFLLMFSRKQVTPIEMRVDEAIKYVMSCGSVLPEKFTF